MSATRDWLKVAGVVLMLVIGAGAKLASLQALIAIRSLGQTERAVARVEAEALRVALAARAGSPLPLSALDGARLADKLSALAQDGYSFYLETDPLVAGSLGRLKAEATAERLEDLRNRIVAGDGTVPALAELDALALLASSVSDTVHNAATVHIEGLWVRVLVLGGGAVVTLIITSLGGSTLAALATARGERFVQRIDDYARRLRQADADKARAVEAAELAAIARSEAMVSESMRRLDEALALAEAGRASVESDLVGERAASERVRGLIDALHRQVEVPINGIRALSGVMRIGHVITSSDRRQLDEIETTGEELLQMSSSILDLVRLDQGQTTLARRPFRPELAAEAALDDVARLADRRGVHVVFTYDEDGVEAYYGDEARLTQLIVNLLRDAILTGEEGRVTLDMDNSGSTLGLIVCNAPAALARNGTEGEAMATLDAALTLAEDLVRRMGGRFTAVALQAGGCLVRISLHLRIVGVADFDADAAADRAQVDRSSQSA